ncbi:hypothetical protein JRQ81_008420 [Phrynocephalus forsythii]|uniref:Uncharacterized protein n=1 Tax=Phrynocephalus forsythii TaxID=171643 RepID=A0A9Q0Y433_9SAUR|nr:hypothetical protein JRQ81_008420 [Phrynocephalus forsythii]
MSSEPQRHAASEASTASKPSKKVKKAASADASTSKKAKTDKHPSASPQRSLPSASNPTLSPNHQSTSPVSVSSEPRSVLSHHGSREDLASLYRDVPLTCQYSPRRAGAEGTNPRSFPSYHHFSAPYWHPSLPSMAQESSVNPEPSARKHSSKRRRSISPKDDLPSSKRSRHGTVKASETAHADQPARDAHRRPSAGSLPSSSDPWLGSRSHYHPFPVPGFPPYPGYPAPPAFMPPPMFPTGLYWPSPYPLPPPLSDPRFYEEGRSRDHCSDPPRKSTHKSKHLQPPLSSDSEHSVPSSSDSEDDNADDDRELTSEIYLPNNYGDHNEVYRYQKEESLGKNLSFKLQISPSPTARRVIIRMAFANMPTSGLPSLRVSPWNRNSRSRNQSTSSQVRLPLYAALRRPDGIFCFLQLCKTEGGVREAASGSQKIALRSNPRPSGGAASPELERERPGDDGEVGAGERRRSRKRVGGGTYGGSPLASDSLSVGTGKAMGRAFPTAPSLSRI